MKILFETERTIIREFISEDYNAVYEFGSNKEVQKYTGDILISSKNQAKDIIKSIYKKDYNQNGYGRWAVIHKSDNKIIGFAGLKYLPEFDKTDIGFRFLPEYWNKGIATEVSNPIIDYGFKNFKLNRVIGIADPKNVGSCKVLQKIGMTFYKLDVYDTEDQTKYNWYEILNQNK